MTEKQFTDAKFKMDQIEHNELLKDRLQKEYNNVKKNDLNKETILQMYCDLGDALAALIEVRKEEFKKI